MSRNARNAPSPAADKPGPLNPHYDPSDDHVIKEEPSPEHDALLDEIERLKSENAKVVAANTVLYNERQAEKALLAPSAEATGPAGLPAGLYPSKEGESQQSRKFPRGTDVSEVLEFDRQEDERRALARIASGETVR